MPKPLQRLADKDGYISIGPIPKGVPINLIGNLEPDLGQLVVLQAKIVKALVKIHAMNLSPDEATAELTKAVPELLAANKCPTSSKTKDITSARTCRIRQARADRISENILAKPRTRGENQL